MILNEAKRYSTQGEWSLSLRRAQESVELALKGSLAWAGVDVPKVHDVGPLLKQDAAKFPSEFASAIRQMAAISRSLRAEREISFYGDPESGIPPEELYGEEDAADALRKAEFVLERCKRLIGSPGTD